MYRLKLRSVRLIIVGLLSLKSVSMADQYYAADTAMQLREETRTSPRGFRSYFPKYDESVMEPEFRITQLLLDRQSKEDGESYLIQVLFHGKPAPIRSITRRKGVVFIDFLNTGKPSTRLARIRGGVIEASSIEQLYYRESGSEDRPKILARPMIRLTLYVDKKVDLKFRNTLNRTLILFKVPKS